MKRIISNYRICGNGQVTTDRIVSGYRVLKRKLSTGKRVLRPIYTLSYVITMEGKQNMDGIDRHSPENRMQQDMGYDNTWK